MHASIALHPSAREAALRVGVFAVALGVGVGGCGHGVGADSESGTGAAEEDFYAVEPGPLCGAVGPVKLLDLDEGSELLPIDGLSRIGDRYYITVGHGRETDVNLGGDWLYQTRYASTTTYSVDRCGGDAKVVSTRLDRVPFTLPRWPARPVACSEGDLVALEPRVVLITDGCGLWPSVSATLVDEGAVLTWVLDESGYTAHSFRGHMEGDAPGFLPPVEITDYARPTLILGDEIVINDLPDYGAEQLRSVTLPDLTATVLVDAWTETFAATASHLLYVGPGGVILRDRADDSEQVVFGYPQDPWSLDPLAFEGGYAVIRDTYYGGGRIIDLESRVMRDVAPGIQIVGPIVDGRWLLERESGEGLLLDHASGVQSSLGDISGEIVARAGDGVVLQEGRSVDLRDPFEVALVPYSGGDRRVLARRATSRFVRLADGRVVTLVNVGDGFRGDLVVVDPATLHEHRIDGPVFAFNDGQSVAGALDPGLVAYQVIDGERSGVYLINLAAP
ncbi:MAG: hypothetical protein H6711_31025 [Myxococcales bacterium]|nr:hypothetical protein [Myxococcales bacterium]